MSDLLIRDFSVPSKCMECEWRDAEACGMCELMIDNPFRSFSDQYAHCPFQVIAKRHLLVPAPPHGRLIDADELTALVYANIVLFDSAPGRMGAEQKLVRACLASTIDDINDAPTIIQASKEVNK